VKSASNAPSVLVTGNDQIRPRNATLFVESFSQISVDGFLHFGGSTWETRRKNERTKVSSSALLSGTRVNERIEG